VFCYGTTFQPKDLKKIKEDLLQSFREIDCWNAQKPTDSIGEVYDSLVRANDNFSKKLKFYAGKYSFTIAEKFPFEDWVVYPLTVCLKYILGYPHGRHTTHF